MSLKIYNGYSENKHKACPQDLSFSKSSPQTSSFLSPSQDGSTVCDGAVFPGLPLIAAESSQGKEVCKNTMGAIQTAVCNWCPEIPLPHLGMKSSQVLPSAHPLPAQSHVTFAHIVTKCSHSLFAHKIWNREKSLEYIGGWWGISSEIKW